MDLIKIVEKEFSVGKEFPSFKAGDTVTVSYQIKEGDKTRVQKFQGIVIQKGSQGNTATFTVRKVSDGIGVERIFPIASPFIQEITVNKRGSVRRARLFYLRNAIGKAARIKEKKLVN
jgi:large subunit ribosomal protein L19